ncbi:hypothetical protein [Cytobacillus pseudoceanisediminis]
MSEDDAFRCGGQVGTCCSRLLLLLSEVAPGSDSLSLFSASSVRSGAKFGLTLPVFCFFCPNERLVQTASPGFQLFLSE